MTLLLSGTNGVSDVDGTAATPAIRGSDTNTGIFFPAADTIAFAEGGVESARFDSAGNLGVGTTSMSYPLTRNGITLKAQGTDGTEFLMQSSVDTSFTGFAIVRAGSNVGMTNRTNGSFDFSTNNIERARFTSSGVFDIGTGAGAVGQIQFPATQVASANANTLDDYEEGSWTPSLRDGGTNRNPTYAHGPSGTYIKVGRLVCVRFGFQLSNKGAGSGSGEIQIHGLPFTATGTGPYQEEATTVSTGNLNTAANAGIARMIVNSGGSYLFGRVLNNGDTPWTYNDLTNSSFIIGEIFYFATA